MGKVTGMEVGWEYQGLTLYLYSENVCLLWLFYSQTATEHCISSFHMKRLDLIFI